MLACMVMFSLVKKEMIPRSHIVQHTYTTWSGQLRQVSNGTTAYWTATDRNPDGGIAAMTLGQVSGGYAGLSTTRPMMCSAEPPLAATQTPQWMVAFKIPSSG